MNENFLTKFFRKVTAVLTRPKLFFEEMREEAGIKSALLYYLIFLAVMNIPNSIYLTLLAHEGQFRFGFMAGAYFVLMALATATLFIICGAYHLFTKILKGQGGYSETFKAMIYSNTPTFLFSIPYLTANVFIRTYNIVSPVYATTTFIISTAVFFYRIYLRVIGFSTLHRISILRVIIAIYVIPLILMSLVISTLFVVFYLISPI